MNQVQEEILYLSVRGPPLSSTWPVRGPSLYQLVNLSLQLSLNLKGGLGISLVNQVREEILYLSLRNITVFYLASKRAITMEMSVANIQVHV